MKALNKLKFVAIYILYSIFIYDYSEICKNVRKLEAREYRMFLAEKENACTYCRPLILETLEIWS